ncbi:MAG: polysaccharide lyase [Peptococcaceae bacterium]|nr:polysaccharide lyase [Peptococcaceae bacterium]
MKKSLFFGIAVVIVATIAIVNFSHAFVIPGQHLASVARTGPEKVDAPGIEARHSTTKVLNKVLNNVQQKISHIASPKAVVEPVSPKPETDDITVNVASSVKNSVPPQTVNDNVPANAAKSGASVSSPKTVQSAVSTSQNKSPIFFDSFEQSLNPKWYLEMPNNTYSWSFSHKYAIDGKSSLRVELRKSDPMVQGAKRAEIYLDPERPLQEHTYSFSILLPQGGDEDYATDPDGSEIVAQWHNTPDPGERWTNPPLALRTFSGHWYLDRCWDDAPLSSDAEMAEKGNQASYDLGSYLNDKGKWVKWTFHVKWGWLPSQQPILEVYKDGVRILDLDGEPNTTNDKVGVYMKLGLYKWDWSQSDDTSILARRVVYYDDVSIR